MFHPEAGFVSSSGTIENTRGMKMAEVIVADSRNPFMANRTVGFGTNERLVLQQRANPFVCGRCLLFYTCAAWAFGGLHHTLKNKNSESVLGSKVA